MAVAAIDWLALTVVTASLLLGAWRGLLYAGLALAGWVLAVLAARWAAPLVGQWLPMGESPEPLRHAVGFALVFIATAFNNILNAKFITNPIGSDIGPFIGGLKYLW